MNILVLNPGGNSLKAQIVRRRPGQLHAYEGRELLSLSIERIGKEPELSVMQDKKKTASEPIEATDFEQAATNLLTWCKNRPLDDQVPALSSI